MSIGKPDTACAACGKRDTRGFCEESPPLSMFFRDKKGREVGHFFLCASCAKENYKVNLTVEIRRKFEGKP